MWFERDMLRPGCCGTWKGLRLAYALRCSRLRRDATQTSEALSARSMPWCKYQSSGSSWNLRSRLTGGLDLENMTDSSIGLGLRVAGTPSVPEFGPRNSPAASRERGTTPATSIEHLQGLCLVFLGGGSLAAAARRVSRLKTFRCIKIWLSRTGLLL